MNQMADGQIPEEEAGCCGLFSLGEVRGGECRSHGGGEARSEPRCQRWGSVPCRMSGENIPGRGKGQGKGPAAGRCWCIPGASGKPGWLDQRERGETEEGRSHMGEWARGASG